MRRHSAGSGFRDLLRSPSGAGPGPAVLRSEVPQTAPAQRGRASRRVALGALGVVLIWGALGALGYVGGWQLHARRSARALVGAEQRLVHHAQAVRHAGPATTPCVVSAPSTGQLAGLLEIPAIHLTAPVEEGTTDAVLTVAVGHDPSSVWPGADGTAALLAHDVSYFVHLDALKAGDLVVYRTACVAARFVVTRLQVVTQGASIPDTDAPSLVLDTCYPSNALFFTSQRLLVWAREEASAPATRAHGGPALAAPALDEPAYRVPAPPALVAQDLTLEQNDAPMGTMTLRGATSPQWAQSPGPLALETAALEAYFGGLHAAEAREAPWWPAIADPALSMPVPLVGAAPTEIGAPLDVTIVSAHHAPAEVVLTTTVTLRGGQAPGTYAETVTEAVHGGTVTLSGWTLRATGA